MTWARLLRRAMIAIMEPRLVRLVDVWPQIRVVELHALTSGPKNPASASP